MPPREDERYDVHLVTKIEGVVLPTWMAACLAACTFALGVVLGLGVLRYADAERAHIDEIRALNREIRILELHAQDIENVLKSKGIATTRDFAAWSPESAPGLRDAAEKEK